MIELQLGTCCPDFVPPWQAWFTKLGNPAAWLATCDDAAYQEHVGRKTRNMLRKADRYFTYSRFKQPNFLADIEDINRSKARRQGIPMTKAYTQPPTADNFSTLCPIHQRIWLGGFDRATEKLVAYLQVVTFENFAILNKIIGHAEHLSHGVMNGLVRFLNHFCYHHGWKHVNYLTMPSKTVGLEAFKYHSGFRETDWALAHA